MTAEIAAGLVAPGGWLVVSANHRAGPGPVAAPSLAALGLRPGRSASDAAARTSPRSRRLGAAAGRARRADAGRWSKRPAW